MRNRTTALLVSLALIAGTPLATSATPIKANSKCQKLGMKVNDLQGRFQCVKSGSKLVWKKLSSTSSSALTAPVEVTYQPKFVAIYSNTAPGTYPNRLILAAYDVPQKVIDTQKIDGFEFAIRKEGSTEWLPTQTVKITDSVVVSTGQTIYSVYWSISDATLGKNLYSRVRSISGTKFGEWSDAKITGTVTPTTSSPVATPAPTPSPTPTPTPTTIPVPAPEVGCSVNYLTPLPYASQRISLNSITWEKDSSGYVSALASMRNDNSMSLRLVEFKFYAGHKVSIVHFDQTLQGNSFFIKDDPKFNSVDGQPGAWLPGQTRTFRLPSNQILECKSITVLSSGFTVVQGIGDN